ncbi:MAG: MgtC/SapB family protein [Candidatus Aenigmarchaeota archaeon]|nr:MgtC/SapB family protein [Candidatus Aenigmarchaeota archaeon]
MALPIGPLELEILIKIVVSAVLGLLIGFERAVHNKPAGMRTHSLVCIGATLFTIVSVSIMGADPSRVAAGIVTGIGFLGAGIIFQSKSRMRGITTATELWVLAAIGLAVGIGFYFAALVTTLIVIFVLIPMKYVEKEAKEALD